MIAYSPTIRRNVELRRDNYFFITPPPTHIGDTALIVVGNQRPSKWVRLCEVPEATYCRHWLAEIV